MILIAPIVAGNHALKTGFFAFALVGSYTLTTQTANAIQNDCSILGHGACGFLLGSLYRIRVAFFFGKVDFYSPE